MAHRIPLPRGIVASSVTPFGPDGALRLDRLGPHIDWLIGEGVDGLSPLGSAGEFAALETDDRKRVLEVVLEANHGRVPVMAGTHHYSTRVTVELSRHAQAAGADALLVVPPYYSSPLVSQAMDHYRRIAEAVDIPVVLYHNARNTNVDFRCPHILTLFEEKVLAGVKMSNPDPDRICELLHATDGALTVYAGIDTVAFEGLCHGAHGWISGIPSIVPRTAARLYRTIAVDGDLPAARDQWRRLRPLMRLLFGSYLEDGGRAHWAGVMKATLNMIGPSVGDPQPPLQPLDPASTEELAAILRALGYSARGPAGVR
jgi:4-hydroxy-tetrahydrodipicolinate synthase